MLCGCVCMCHSGMPCCVVLDVSTQHKQLCAELQHSSDMACLCNAIPISALLAVCCHQWLAADLCKRSVLQRWCSVGQDDSVSTLLCGSVCQALSNQAVMLAVTDAVCCGWYKCLLCHALHCR
jgi:hypothetical protein